MLNAEHLLPVNDEERSARDGIERFDAPIQEHRQPAKLLHLETAAPVVLKKRREDVNRCRHDRDPNSNRGQLLHPLLFLTNPNRCIENWVTNPSATSPHAM